MLFLLKDAWHKKDLFYEWQEDNPIQGHAGGEEAFFPTPSGVRVTDKTWTQNDVTTSTGSYSSIRFSITFAK